MYHNTHFEQYINIVSLDLHRNHRIKRLEQNEPVVFLGSRHEIIAPDYGSRGDTWLKDKHGGVIIL
jgi:hypothetical protein